MYSGYENSSVRRAGLICSWTKCGTNLAEMPDLEMDDLRATLSYAARKLDHPVLVA